MAYRAAENRYQNAQFARSGRSGLQLPRVSLGLWHNFGGDHLADAQRALVLGAFDRGIIHFDLANNYGPPPGSAERHFGEIVANDLRAYRDELVISTKAGYHMWPGPFGEWGSRKGMLASLDQSLERMQLDYVDVFYSHRPDPNTPIAETMSALVTAVRSGKALYVGVSNYDAEQTRAAAAALAAEGIPLTIHQPRYSMLDRRPEPALFDTLSELGTGAIVFSPLEQGKLTNRYLAGVPADSRATHSVFLKQADITPEYLQLASGLDGIAQERGQSLAQLALSWCLRRPEVTSVLVGASKLEQLDDNLAALDAPALAEAELSEIDSLVAAYEASK